MIYLVNTIRSTYKAVKKIRALINKTQVTDAKAALQECKASEIIGQTEVRIINLAQLGSLEDKPILIPFNRLEELPDRRLYPVPRRKDN